MKTRRSLPIPCLVLVVAGAMPRPAPAQCAADIAPEGAPDGVVDVFDLLVVFACHGPPCAGDINGDRTLDGVDLALLLLHWGPCEQDLVVGSTTADLVVVNVTDPTTAGRGLRELDVFVQLENPDAVLLSVFDAEITNDGGSGFAHSAGSGWEPLTELFWDLLGLAYDSFVTVGPAFGDDNFVEPDPSFTSTATTVSGGWFQASADFVQGRAGEYADNRVRIATLTVDVGSFVDGTMTISLWDAAGDPFFAPAAFAASARLGDVDADGTVGIQDFLAMLASWGSCPSATAPCPADADGSGTVGIEDLLIVLGGWG